MEQKKIVGGVYTDVSDQVTQICATCKWASPFQTVDYVVCSKKGLINSDYVCKHYEYNRLLKKNTKKKKMTREFSDEDFSID